MGLRFRRSIGLLPGVKLNLSRRGPSVSLGRRGIHYTIGQKGNRFTVGLPGTGLSYTEYEPHQRPTAAEDSQGPASAGRRHIPVLGFVLFVVLMAAFALWSTWSH